MKKLFLFLGLLSGLSVSAATQNVTITVTGIKEAKGNILISVFDSADNFPKPGKEIKKISIPATAEAVTAGIDDLEAGEYAFAVLHDKNANGKCDQNLLGVPREGIGFSTNFKPKTKAPSFNAVKVTLKDSLNMSIKLLYF